MSKSLGNVLDALEMLNKGSVDLLRFYIMWKSSPVDALSLDTKEMTGQAIPGAQHALPPARLPEAERRAGRLRPEQAHGRSGRPERSSSRRWTSGSSTTSIRRCAPSRRLTGRAGTTTPARSSSTR